jgi:uncharacterized repeat protein (TIGR01451 family)
MMNSRIKDRIESLKLSKKIASFLMLVCLLGTTVRALTDNPPTPGETVIVNRADATYNDENGTTYSTVSPTVTVTVVSVPAITVTPDETVPSVSVEPNEQITRLFRICNTGNAEGTFLPIAAEISAPATITNIFYDADNSGTVTSGDAPVTINQTLTPRLAPGACYGVLFVIETGAVTPQTQISIRLTARSTIALTGTNNFPQDAGTIINAVGSGVIFTSPTDTSLPPVKLVENLPRTIAAPAQILNYTIAFRNNGSSAARQVRVTDDLPIELEYVANTLRLNNRSLTDQPDTDEGTATARRIELLISEIAPDAVTQIQFQARLNGAISGNGVVNFASISASNAPTVNSSNAVAVVSPVGTIYAGNSGGAIRIGGARITIATDASGAPLNLVPNIGYSPNAENVNPYSSDANGNFSFALAENQIGTGGNPAHYLMNVTAPNYRPRQLEIAVQPAGAGGSNGFYTATVRALDGQTVAAANSFELTQTAVQLPNLAALVFNVPMFEHSTLEISKSADKQFAEIGDIVSYRLQIRNATASALRDVTVRDTLPASFVYAVGTAQIEIGREETRQIEPQTNETN